MNEVETQAAEANAEAQAIAQAQAGYDGKARAQAPAEPVATKDVSAAALPDQSQTSAATPAPEGGAEPEAQAAKPDPTADIKQQLDDLRAQVREMATNGSDAATVRKMHGDIGEINRTLKQLKALEKKEAPAEDELAAALKKAEETAIDYPEIAGPLVGAIKVLQSRLNVTPAKPEQEQQTAPAVDPHQVRERFARETAIRALDEVHPDRHQIRELPEFKAWFASKTPEYRTKVTTSWNPAVVAQPFDDWKKTVAARQAKQQRLEAAATPQGLPRTTPTTISDEEAARIGYERKRGKRL